MNMKENAVSKIRWIIKEFELDTQPIRARLVNKANTTRASWQVFFCNRAYSQVCSKDRLWIIGNYKVIAGK